MNDARRGIADVDARTSTGRAGGLASKFALVVALVLAIALLVFVLQNTLHTTINFIGWNHALAQGISLPGAAVVGAARLTDPGGASPNGVVPCFRNKWDA